MSELILENGKIFSTTAFCIVIYASFENLLAEKMDLTELERKIKKKPILNTKWILVNDTLSATRLTADKTGSGFVNPN